jgi:alpha-galactosidase
VRRTTNKRIVLCQYLASPTLCDPYCSFALLSPRDSRTEFSFWSLWSSPLIVTSDVRNLFGHRKEILTNAEVIAINQDSLATAGDRVSFNNETGAQVWSKPLSNGDVAILLYNSHDKHDIDVACSWRQFGFTGAAAVRDLWQRKDLGRVETGFSARLGPHDVTFLRVTPAA